MKLVDVLREECIVAGAQLSDKARALEAVVQAAKKCRVLKDVSEQDILAGLEKRETLGSTGFGKGIAIPHCRLKDVREFVVGIITVPAGVEFEALDGQKVNIIIFILAPQAESNAHIRLLSAVSQTLLAPGAVKEMLAGTTQRALYESFLRHSRAEIETNGRAARSLLHIFVQQEDMFLNILQMLTAGDTSSLVVLDAQNAGAYLAKIPLFADLWHDESSRFSKVIIAVVEKGLANETVRRIESITGRLNEHSGTLVTMQDVHYAAGSLNMQV